jgi:hypothetical protein
MQMDEGDARNHPASSRLITLIRLKREKLRPPPALRRQSDMKITRINWPRLPFGRALDNPRTAFVNIQMARPGYLLSRIE